MTSLRHDIARLRQPRKQRLYVPEQQSAGNKNQKCQKKRRAHHAPAIMRLTSMIFRTPSMRQKHTRATKNGLTRHHSGKKEGISQTANSHFRNAQTAQQNGVRHAHRHFGEL